MAYRQYIGARYVPLFDGVWNATKNYEPLTVVEDGNGNSYTSKKDVPAGTPLTDRSYWMLTATFSGAVEQLRREVDEHENEITQLQSDVANAQSDIRDLDERVTDLEGVNVQARNEILITDSYGRPDIPNIGTPWQERIKTMLPNNYAVETFYKGGCGFGWPAGHENLFNNFIINSVIPNVQFTPNDVTDVVILGGANDGNLLQLGDTTQTSIQNNAVNAINSLKAQYPNALISLAFAGSRYVPAGSEDVYRTHYIKARFSWEQAAKTAKGGASVSNAQYILANNAYLDDNNIHPNEAGSYQLALSIAQYLKTGSLSVMYLQDDLTPTPFNTTISFDNDARFRQILQDGTATLALYRPASNFRVLFSNPITITSGRFEQPIITLPRGIFRGVTDRIPNTPSAVTVGISGGGVQTAMGGLMVFNGYVYLQVYTTTNISNVGAVVILNSNLTIESDYR